ncbi:hypothetical protein COB57_00715 [Candidatus Peregrinibacteria bacterium]|nr:MAG: hypothetical protein COB57_00715 [Candidatus Peregrinibacteria bacterium]
MSQVTKNMDVMKVVREVFHFLITFMFIFVISFAVMNFSGIKSIASYYFSSGESEALLEEVVEVVMGDIKPLVPAGAKKMVEKSVPPLKTTISPLDYRLVIPKLGVNVPIGKMSDQYISDDLWSEFEGEIQNSLRNGVVHYPGTANPGEFGNVFVTGHSSYYPWDKGNYKDVFAKLILLDIGDEYYIYFNQKKYSYRIRDKREVDPSEVGVLEQPEGVKLATLMTCWPLGTVLHRLILIAEEV